MFLKAALAFLAIGAFSVNALTAPVARSPAPEPGCELPKSFPITSYYDLTSPSTAQELEAWMLKRDLSYDLFSRELQALDELFSREPEDWAQWAKRQNPAGTDTRWPGAPPVRAPVQYQDNFYSRSVSANRSFTFFGYSTYRLLL